MFQVTNYLVVGSKIILEFNNGGAYRVFNADTYFRYKDGPVIDEIREDGLTTVKIEGRTLEWFNGYDIDPEVLYDNTTRLRYEDL